MVAQVVDRNRLPVADAQTREPQQPVGSGDRGRDEGNAGVERDPRGSGVSAGLELLDEPFPLPRAVREHHDDVALAGKLDGNPHGFDVAFPAPNGKAAA